MKILKYIIDFFFSLRTTLWILGLLLLLFLAGAFIMPGRQAFQTLHFVPLFEWLQKQPLELTWWLWGLIGILVIFTINTLFCSIESIVKKRKGTHWLLLISPQIIHIGFLFVLLAHLLSAISASQELVVAREGSSVKIYNTILKIKDINIRLDYYGYITDWEVSVEYQVEGKTFKKDIIKPNNPSIQMGLNINIKDLRPYPVKAVLLQINRDPGAIWALVGGIMFMIGIVTLIILKIKIER
jgi:uncharacterized membrane protein YphA (DoxX/SURF4 family)